MIGSKRIQIWLIVILFLIFSMVIVGGVTRLTNSGLSMVHWKPIMGAIPPTNQAEWQSTFEAYQTSPEFKKINSQMNLHEFKFIFFWEYAHRLLGRVIGVVFILPLLLFWYEGRITHKLGLRLSFLFLLGGLQGLLGWYMVKSGLVDNPHVSHYRLTAHLFSAVLLFALVLWTLFDLQKPLKPEKVFLFPSWSLNLSKLLLFLVSLQIIYGALAAGLKAGYVYNTFPMLNNEWIPFSLFTFSPWWRNFIDNQAWVQFTHRTLAWLILLCSVVYWSLCFDKLNNVKLKRSVHLLILAIAIQFTLGVLTLLYQTPLLLAALHQGGALFLLSSVIYSLHIQWGTRNFMPSLTRQN